MFAIKTRIANRYILQEWPDDSLIQTLESNLSDLPTEKFKIISGKWGDKHLNKLIMNLGHIDLLIMADCFYDKKNYPHLLTTISETMNSHPSLKKAVCIYHHRK